MNGSKVGALVGAVGGLLFVLLNANVLPSPWSAVVVVVGVLLFVLIVRLVLRTPPDPAAYRPVERQMQALWITIGLEVVALVGGAFVLVTVLDAPAAALPWISLVLGVHWLVFYRVFVQDVFLWLGWLVGMCGVVGLMAALAKVGAEQAPTVVGGLLPGAIMLGAVALDARRRRQTGLGRR
jgi:hypothetical protein